MRRRKEINTNTNISTNINIISIKSIQKNPKEVFHRKETILKKVKKANHTKRGRKENVLLLQNNEG